MGVMDWPTRLAQENQARKRLNGFFGNHRLSNSTSFPGIGQENLGNRIGQGSARHNEDRQFLSSKHWMEWTNLDVAGSTNWRRSYGMAFGLDSLASTVFLCPSMIVTATKAVDSSRVDQSGQASLHLKTSASSFDSKAFFSYIAGGLWKEDRPKRSPFFFRFIQL